MKKLIPFYPSVSHPPEVHFRATHAATMPALSKGESMQTIVPSVYKKPRKRKIFVISSICVNFLLFLLLLLTISHNGHSQNIISVEPKDGDVNVKPDTDLTITFDVPIEAGKGQIEVFQNNKSTDKISVKSNFVTINGNIAVIEVKKDLEPGASIYVIVPDGAFVDESGNDIKGITDPETWNYSLEGVTDETPPVITDLSPADEEANVPIDANLALNFDEEVVKGTGNIVIYQGSTTQTIAVTNAAVSINGNQVTIDPPANFPLATPVYVTIQAGAFTDVDGNAFEGITNSTTWNFATEDTTSPVLTTLSPADNSTNVAIDADLVLTFNENIQTGTGNIVITQGATSQTIAVSDEAVSVNGNQVTLNPSNFPNGATITVTVPEGAFTDQAGNEFAGIAAANWSFTTLAPADTEAPSVITYAPEDEATAVALASNLTLTFSEEVVKGSGNITITHGATSQTIPVSDGAVTVNENVVTIDPPTDFPSQSAVSVQIAAGTFTDVAGNAFAGITTNTTWNFTSEDKTAPVVTSYSPSDNFIGVQANANLVLTFSEPMQKAEGTITLNQGLTTQQITVGSGAVTVNDNIITIDPPADFPFLATVWVEIPQGAFTDVSGNEYEGISEANVWNFTVLGIIDATAPTLTATTPADEATNVSIAGNLQLTFSEEIEKGSGNITITHGATSQTIAVTDASVVVNGSIVTIDPTVDLPEKTLVSVQIEAGAFEDAAGNEFAGITNNTSWNFTTEDKTSPALTSFTPANNATDVATDASLVLSFDENIQVGAGTITINQGTTSQTILLTSGAVNVAGNIVTINPPADFPNSATIMVTVPEGVFTDEAGNKFDGIAASEWIFTTEAPADAEAPIVTTYAPADNTTNVTLASDLTLTFSEPVVKGTGNIVITQGATSQTIPVSDNAVSVNGNQVTINPSADFPSQTAVSVQIEAGAFTDAAGNAFSGITNNTSWNFTTEDNIAPALTSFTPANNATEVAVNASLVISFSENIQAGTGNIIINQGATSQTIPVTDAAVTIAGNQVTINPSDFPNSAIVTVTVPEGAFTDEAGNEFAGMTASEWSFTTEAPADNQAPTVTSYAPADGSLNVDLDANLVLNFSEAVQAGTGNVVINQGANTQTIAVTDVSVSINGNQVTINPPLDFPSQTAVNVQIEAGAFQDLAGNNYTGITSADVWNFTTKDIVAPTLVSLSPANGETNVAANKSLVLTFNENIIAGIGNITISQGTSIQTIAVTSPAVSIAANIVTIDPVDFLESFPVSVEVPSGVFRDVSENEFAGIAAADWGFITGDLTNPAISSRTPLHNATEIDINATLQLVFNEPVIKGTGNIVLTQGATSQTIPVTELAVTISGNQVSIDPPADFSEGIQVNVTIPASAFTDVAGNTFTGIASGKWNFTTKVPVDNTAPTVTAYSPQKDAGNVLTMANLILTFSEDIVEGTGNITITQGVSLQVIPVSAVSINGNVVTINPPLELPEKSQISIQIQAGAFNDAAGNKFAGITDNTTWNFTTEDNTAPSIATLSPANNSTNVAVEENLVLTFGENIQVGAGAITINQGTTSQSIPVTDAAVTIAGNQVTINPSDFPNSATVTVTIPEGAFTDESGNTFAGIAASEWSFTTESPADTEAPTITAYTPADNSNNVTLRSDLQLTFSEPVVKGAGNIVITQGATSQTIVVSDVSVVVNGTEVTINPPADFPSQTAVSIQIEAGAFTDAAGNEFSGITNNTSWNFTTEDNTVPALTTFTPANNTTDVAIDASLVLSFNEPIEKGNGNIVITQQGTTSQTIAVTDASVSVSENTVTINPADFLHDAVITVSMPAGVITDAAGNEFAGISATEWRFTTTKPADAQAPVISLLSPADGAENVEVDAVLTVTFNESIEKGTGNITISQGTTSQVIPVSDAAVSINAATVTINPPADFPEGSAISVQIADGVFKDLAGNNFAGITNTTTWNFTTAQPDDVTPPAVTTYTPADESVNIAASTNLVLTFNEAIEKGTGNITINQGTTSQVIPVASGDVSIAGNVATIDVTDNIPSGAAVSVQIEAGAFKDVAGNPYEGIQNTSTWNFSVADTEAPALVSLTPADDATDIAADADLQIVYNEAVVKGIGNITINQGANSQTIPVTDAAISITGATISINPPADFPANTLVNIQWPDGAFKDISGNNAAAINNNTGWNFTTAAPLDVTAPTISTLSPADEATDINVAGNLILTFSENVEIGEGNIIITQGVTTQTIAVTSGDIVVNGNQVTINPPADFPEKTLVSVQIEAGAFTNVAGNEFAGINNNTTWNFTTEDKTAPVLTSFTPANNATEVAIEASLVLTFSEQVAAGTGNITISQGASSQTILVTSGEVSVNGNQVTINPSDFPNSATITITVPEGAFTDAAGNEFAGIAATEWSFTTEAPADTEVPTITAYAPADEATNIALAENLVLTFSEQVVKGTGIITINQGATSQIIDVITAAVVVNGNQVTINPPADFPSQVPISVEIAADVFRDVSGNSFAGILTPTAWNFTTEDITAATLTAFTPANNSTNVEIDDNLVLTFSENIVAGVGSLTINQGTTSQTIPVSDPAVSITGNTVTINPSDFPNSATITITVPEGAFTDESGNEFSGIAASEWSFNTESPADTEAPTITAYTPADNSNNVTLRSDLTLTFSEPVVKGAGNIVITQGATSQTIAVSNASIVVNGTEVTINPPLDFPSQTEVSVQLEAGSFKDLAGNDYTGITNNTSWNFTTEDNIAPALTSFTPANNATDIAIDAGLVISFSENIQAGTGNIIINQGSASQTIAVTDAAVTIAGNQVTINPSNFPNSTTITVTVPEGVFNDEAGNEFAGIAAANWSFTTEALADTEAPVVTTYAPADDSNNIPVGENLVLTFDEAIQKGSGSISIKYGSSTQVIEVSSASVTVSGTQATINPALDLPEGTPIQILIQPGTFTDITGNEFAGIADETTWNFSTEDTTEPIISELSPADGASNIARNTHLILTFSEPVQKGTGNITINEEDNIQIIPVTNAAVTISGAVATINPPAELLGGKEVTVDIPVGAFKDVSGNNFNGITNAWNFTVADEDVPVVTAFNPVDGATNVDVDANLTITFSEEVVKGTGNILINQGATSQTIPVTDAAISLNGNQVTINPPADFPSGAQVSIQIAAGAFKDVSGNEYTGITSETAWNFTAKDIIAPVVTSRSPANNASTIAVNANLVLEFSETIKVGEGNITINKGTNTQVIPVKNPAFVSVSGNTATINPADFPNNASVSITIPEGTFTDEAGNTFAGIASTEWSFITEEAADETAPVVTSYAPADEATDVALASNLVLTFDEEVFKGTGNIVIYQEATTQTIAVTETDVILNGNQVTINPPLDFPSGTPVYVTIQAGAFTDVDGNAFTGITNNTTWNFTTEDTTSPALTTLSPADKSTNVAIDADLVLTFNENVQAGTGNIVITQGATSQTIAVTDAAVTIADNVVTINPAEFPNGATITVTIPQGAFSDEGGNEFAGIAAANWSFTTLATADTEAPSVITYVPEDEATAVALASNLTLTFSEEVVKGSGNITITHGATSQTIPVSDGAVTVNENVVTIDPPTDFPSQSAVSVQIPPGAFTDLSGNAYAGITTNTTWNFTSEDKTAPVVTSYSPSDNFIGVQANANLVLTFSEPMQKAGGTITLHQGLTTQQITVGSGSVTVNDNIITIDPPADFPFLATVWVEIPQGAFTDVSGNAYAGITAANVWNFTVIGLIDATAPTLTATTPADEATNVSIAGNLQLTFSEEIQKGSGNITITHGATSQTIAVSDGAVGVSGSTVTIDPPLDFPSQTQVSVQIQEGAFEDAAGNAFAGIENSTTWNFTTEDNTAPEILTLTPADDLLQVPVNTNLEITFDENIQKGAGEITINQGTTTQQIAVSSANVTIDGTKVTIDIPDDMPAGTNVYVQLPQGAFTDISGNQSAFINEATAWNFRTVDPIDNTPPSIVTLSPADKSTDVAIDAELVLTFDEAVKAGTGSITITHGEISQTIPVTDAAISIADNTITINPSDFPNSVSVSITVPAGAFTDESDNAFPGIAATEWSFTTEAPADTEVPTITTYAPADEATNIALAENLVLTFSEQVVKGTGIITINQGTTSQIIDVITAAVVVNGNQVTINPPDDFPSQAPISVEIAADVFKDVSGNSFAGILTPTAWNFTTEDITAATLTAFTPANATTEVAVNQNLELTFDEPIQAGTGTIIINQGETSQTIAVTDAAVTIADNVVTINPADFPNNATITVTIPEGAFTDAAGNAFAGIAATDWSFTTAAEDDNTAPVITAYSPVSGSINVPASQNLILTFNEQIVAGTGKITITQGNASQEIVVPDGQVTIAGNTVTINPAADLLAGEDIAIQIEAGTFTDVAGNPFAGIINSTTWTFTTEEAQDETAPIVSEYAPADNGVDVPLNTNLVLTFNEPIEKGTGNITITQGADSQIIPVTDATVSINDNTVTINPATDFAEQTLVYVQIEAGAFTDASGNNYTGIADNTTWNFTTAATPDNIPPALATLVPANNANNIAIDANLIVTFNEPVVAAIGNITINQGATSQTIAVTDAAVVINGNEVTINPADFPNGTIITVTVPEGAFTDAAGNAFAGIVATDWSFTTEAPVDTEAPTVITYVPADEATQVAVAGNLVLIFSETVVKGAGNIVITQGATSQTIPVTDATVTINGTEVTINPPADFPAGTDVDVQIEAGAFKDAAGNNYEGIANNTTWNFTTAATPDNVAPTLATFVPADDANNIAVNANLVLTFSEEVVAGEGNITINQGATSQIIPIADAAVIINGNQVTINPPQDFQNGATISVTIPAGVITDAAGNEFAGVATDNWSFTTSETADIEGPIVTTYVPEDDANDIDIASNLILTFNEPVEKGAGNITITQGENIQTIPVSDAAVSVQDNQVTIDPPADLPEGTPVSVQIEAGAFTDVAGNNYGGIADNTTWNFTAAATIDETAPTLTAFTPANAATEVAVNQNLELTFDEPVQAGTGTIIINQGETSQTIAVTDAAVTIADNVVTINPADFPNNATITVTIPEGAFTDAAGNAFAGIAATDWSFTTAAEDDNTVPVITTLVPSDEAIDVPVDANLVITFNEPVETGGGNIIISQGTTSQTIAVTDAAVTVDGNTVTVNPPADFPAETAISIQVDAGAFKDLAGNNFEGIVNTTTWNFTTVAPADIIAPVISSFTPAHNAADIAIGQNITLTFSEPVVAATGNITINQGATSQTIAVTDAAVVINGNEVTINPADFPNGTIITVTVPEGAFTDAAGNAFAGIAATDWSFTILQAQDETAPVLTETLPVEGAVNVAANENITLTFDENVKAGSGNITIAHNATSQTIPVTDAAFVNITGNIVTINPADFPNSATVTVTIPAGAFQDAAGNNTEAITRTFSVTAPADETDPFISSLSPPHDATNVTVNADLVITLNEEVKKGTGTITINQGGTTQTIDVSDETVSIQGTTVTINPPEDFPAGSAVSIQMPEGVFTDLADNPFAGIPDATTWNFTVASPADNIPPLVASFAPADGAQNVAAGSNLIITFNEPVKKGRGNLIINLGNSTQTLNVASEAVIVQGNTVTINPPEDFPSGTNVNILMLSGVFTDLANNSYAGIDNAETWNFSVPDNIPPLRTLLYPPDNSTDVPPNINLIMIFSENIKKGTGTITITREGTTQTQEVDVNSDAVTVSGTTVIINPTVNFPAAATVTIQMPEGVFTDISGNPYTGISDPTEWNLTISGTIDVTPPSIVELQPEDDAVEVAPTSNLVITFSENVQKGTGNITITQGATTQVIPVTSEAVNVEGTTVTIDPPNDLPEGAAVNVQIPSGVFSDVSNNIFAGITNATTWNFTVNTATPSDNIAPEVSTLSPADDAVNVPLDTDLVITFNEAVKKGSGLIVIQQNNASRIINVNSNEVSVNGNVVTINPTGNFPANRSMYVLITEGTFTDIAGNDFAGISEETGWNFTTGAPVDNTPPSVTAYAPADNAQNVPVTANLVLTFNETVKKGNGNITITQGNTTQTINVNSNAVSIAGNKVTINPVADFPVSTAISVQMTSGIFTDNAGNNYAGIANATTWNFTTADPADTTPPTATIFNPADGATNVAVGANLSITFSEPVVKGTGNITITQGATTQTIAVTSAVVTINGATVTVNPPANFPAGTAISVQMAAGTFKDTAGNNFAGITNATTWNFTTIQAVDTTPPQEITLSPADNAQNVAPNANLVITFNEPVKAGTGTIVINQGTTSQTIAVTNAAVTVDGSTVTINPPADFPADATIGVEIPQGAITDLAGNAYEGLDATQWSFTVAPGADNTPPQISTLSPANNAVNVPVDVNLSITFNEAIEKGTGNILIRQGNTILQTIAVTNASVTVSENTLTLNPPVNLPEGTLVNVQMEAGVVKDLAGNAFSGITNATAWRFTTVAPADNTPPVLSSLSPVNGAINVAANTNLSLTFNEKIKKNTGSITIIVNGINQLIPVANASITISENTVTINPAADFPNGAQVSVEVPAGVFADEANNNFTGIASSAWQFTVATPVDNIPPVVTTFIPADNSINVSVDTDLLITFNEPIDKGNGNIEIRQDGTLLTIPVSDPAVTISGNTVTINPASDFRYGASVNVQMLSGVFVDKAGNPFAGIGNAGVWGFEIAVLPDQVTPIVTALSPADNAQNVAITENLVITFSEQVQKGTGNISISQNGTVQQIPVGDASVSVSENIVTINPPANFLFEATVIVEIEAGAFTDNSDNAFAGISGNETWNFTIAPAPDTKAPAMVGINPADEAIEVVPDTELTVTFSEAIQKGSGTIILTQGTSSQTIDINSSAINITGAVLTINPEADFPSGASVSVLIIPGAITDLAGNAFAGITDAATWNFTIQDIIAPQLTAIFPEDNATGIAVNTNLVMSFDEDIKKGTGVITISDGTTTQTIDVNSDAIIVSGTTVIINPPANFGFDATISVQMGSGVLTDLAGNPFAGITDPAAWTITVAGFVDDVPPAVVSLSPEDNATLVPSNAILEMVFSENVQKGAGAITINQGGISKTIDVSSGSVTINGAKVTILPGVDFELGAEVYVLVPKGAFADLSNNPFAGILTDAGWNFTIDQTVPVSIVSTDFPEVILSSEATTQASVELNRVPPGLKVEFVSRGIAREQWQKQTLSSSTLTFTASMPQTTFDEIGLEYYFDITLASGFKIASDTGYTYIQYVGNGLDVTDLKFGNQVSDYQIISVPLELSNKQITNVLEDNLGEYNIKKWRLFNYKNELLQEYKEGFTTMEAGEAYWLIVKNEANVNTGEGTTLKVRKNNPYTLTLKKGWNQIGNPYNFNISWTDVRTYNKNPEGLGNLRPFEAEFLDSDVLKKQRGAFVFVENDMTIQIPVLKNNAANGRISAEQELKFTPNALWEINFALRSKELPYRLAGLGMHPEANQSKDRYDDITVPRFVKYLEMNFKHPEYFAPDFTRDIRPVEENQMWEFTVESNLEPQAVNLQWHFYFSQGYENGKKLMLLDVNHNRIVDLSRQNQYSFWQDSLTAFRMYYGSPEYIREHLQSFQTSLSENYPNPFKDNTTITFILSKVDASYQVKLEVYSINGQKIATLAEGAYTSGAYQINWHGTDNTGKKLPPGMYIYKLETNSESGPATFIRKMVLQ